VEMIAFSVAFFAIRLDNHEGIRSAIKANKS